MQTPMHDATPWWPDGAAPDMAATDSDPLHIGYESAMPWLQAPVPADRPVMAPPAPASAAS